MKSLRTLSALSGITIAAAALVAGTATSSSASVGNCPDSGVVCTFRNANYAGSPSWTESRPGFYSFTGSVSKASSVINRTSYKVRIVGDAENLGLCLKSGHAVRDLPDGFDDKVSAIEIKPSSSSSCNYNY